MAQRVTQSLIYAELIALKETLQVHSAQDDSNFQELKQILNGSASAPGIKMQVDRLEQKEMAREAEHSLLQRRLLVVYGTLGSLFVGVVLLFLK